MNGALRLDVVLIARSRVFYRTVLLFLVLTITVAGLPARADVTSEEAKLLQLINQERASRNIAALNMNSLLYKVAKDYSKEMMENGFFSHVSKVDGSTLWDRIERSGYYDNYGGQIAIRENIGMVSGPASASAVHPNFMNSEGHRDNLLASDVNEAGIGMTEGTFQSIFVTIYVEVFAYHSREQTNTLLGTVSPDVMTVQRGQTAVFKIHVDSNAPAWVYVQVTNIAPALIWNIDKSAGMTPHDASLSVDTASASPGTYIFNVNLISNSQQKVISPTLIVLPPAQTTTQTTISTTSSTTEGTTSTTSSTTTSTSSTSTTAITSMSTSSTQLTSTTTTSQGSTSLTSSSSPTTISSSQAASTTTTSTITTGLTLIQTMTSLTVSSSSQATTTATASSTSSSTSQVTETKVSLRTIALPTLSCVIATAAFGSELSPEIQFLREFRDEKAMSTFGGRMFMATFNAAYYSVSPSIAAFISQHSLVASPTRVLIYPLIIVLRFTTSLSEYMGGGEAPMVLCGLSASMLLGLVYLFPLVFLVCYSRKHVRPLRRLSSARTRK